MPGSSFDHEHKLKLLFFFASYLGFGYTRYDLFIALSCGAREAHVSALSQSDRMRPINSFRSAEYFPEA